MVEHSWGADEHDAAGGLASAIGQGPGQEGLAGPGLADEEGVDAFVDEGDVMKRQIASLGPFATRIEVEIKAVDGVDLGEVSALDAAVDGASHAALLLFVA